MNDSWNEEYPRPLLRRDSFLPLNGGWTLNGRGINLPWPPEAELSGFEGGAGEELEYLTRFTLPEGFLPVGHRLILNFGAVDQSAEVFVNGRAAVSHEGGYLPFWADITDLIRPGENELRVLAVDRLSTDYPYGKQCKKPHGMWYTPVSGIWQTVWLEAVPERGAVRSIKTTPVSGGVLIEVDTDAQSFTVSVPAAGVSVSSGERLLRVNIPSPRLWTPEEPFLYDLTVETAAETVSGYFALRTVSLKTENGRTQLCLNGEPVFLNCVLDQGYFPGGLFLPEKPSGYERDILAMKELGFNALRKHVKLEPEAFYYACDRLGMLVLQDMVNSGEYSFFRDTLLPTIGLRNRADTQLEVPQKRRELFEEHVSGTVERLYNHPSVIGYTIFNEGWGQYDSDRIYRDCRRADPTRFFITASGWFAQREGDADSRHMYFRNKVLKTKKHGKFLMISECGGFSRRVEGHVRTDRKNYGYGARKNSEEALTAKIEELYRKMVIPSIKNGLCGGCEKSPLKREESYQGPPGNSLLFLV